MNKILSAEVKMAQMAVSNLSDETRAFDISAIVTYNTLTNTFGMNQNGQVSSGTVNEDGKTITGLATQSTKGSEKESKTTKNLFEANLKIANFADLDPYTAADPVIDESFNLFNENSKIAPKIYSSETYRDYSSTLWTEKQSLVAAVAKGEMTGAQAIEAYREKCGVIADTILAEANAQ